MASLPSEIFLSHDSRDAGFALRVAEVLRQHGLPVWYSPTEIKGSQQWHDEIGSALDRCDWFTLVLSPRAIESRWVKRELLYVLGEPKYEGRIVPILYEACSPRRLSWTLSAIQYVDFSSDQQSGFRELLRVWGKGYQEAPPRPS